MQRSRETTVFRAGRERPHVHLLALAAAGAALTAAAVAVALHGAAPGDRALAALAHGLVIAAPVGAGIYALHRDPGSRFARLLVAAGLFWAPIMFTESQNDVLYSVGRIWVWLLELTLIYLILAFPSGRLATRADEIVFFAGAIVLIVLYLPTALVIPHYPVPVPWSSCGTACPPNAFMLTSSEPGVVAAVILPLRELATAFLYLAVAARVAVRLARGSHPMRRVLAPVLVVAIFRLVSTIAFTFAREADPSSSATDLLGMVTVLGTAAFPLAFLLGLVRRRAFAAGSLRRLSRDFAAAPTAGRLREVIADAVGDPDLEVAYWTRDPGRWVDTAGHPVQLPTTNGRAVTEIADGDRRVAALVHDAALAHEPTMLEVARGFALMALENQRLDAELAWSLRALQESRSRIIAAADDERRRIERDLHDGAQQQLVALRIRLELARERLEEDPASGVLDLESIGTDIDDAIDQVRSLARGVYPPLLADQGIAEALRAAAHGGPLRTSVETHGLVRYPQAIESAVYFCCLEALQNATKHAAGATAVAITLSGAARELHFEVVDDGAGMPGGADEGAGLTNMHDRVAAAGGRLTIASPPGEGTRITGSVPIGTAELPPEEESLLRRATDALADGFGIFRPLRDDAGVVADFVVEHVNDAACREVGLAREVLVGRALGELPPAGHGPALEAALRRAAGCGEPAGREGANGGANGPGPAPVSEVWAASLGGERIVATWRVGTEALRRRTAEELPGVR